jgi:branched-chain amino acid transport system permease protein
MTMIFGVPVQLLLGQLLIGAINGAFYAILAMGLAIIFGLLNVINFAHGALFMVGAFVAWMLLDWFGIGYWWALLLSPLIVGCLGLVMERTLIRRLYALDHVYGLLLTFGITLMLESVFRNAYGTTGMQYPVPAALSGGVNLGFMFLPVYRGWVIIAALVVCVSTWYVIERTSLGAKLRAATENAPMVQAFGVNVSRLVMLTYAGGVALAALAGVLAGPIYTVSPAMGSNLVIVVFAVVVIGGMGSIMGAVVTGFGLGLLEGIAKVYYSEGSSMVIFIVMIIVLLARPAGLFGRTT